MRTVNARACKILVLGRLIMWDCIGGFPDMTPEPEPEEPEE